MSKLAEKFSKKGKEKKELTPEQQKRKTIGGWIVNILSIIIIVFALVFAILTIIRVTNSNGVTAVAGKVYMNVMSDSMVPTFKTGDVIIAKEFNGDVSTLKVGQVITFKATINGYETFNTHRIIKINGNYVITRGDNQKDEEGNIIDWHNYLDDQSGTKRETVQVKDIVAVWGDVEDVGGELVFHPGKIMKGAGLMSNWLHDPEQGRIRFFCVIVLPLILLFVAYAFVLIRTLVIAKLENAKEVKADTTVTVDSLSDEEKRRLAEEYLASLKAQESAPEASEPKADAPAEVPFEELSESNDAPTPESVAENPTEAE